MKAHKRIFKDHLTLYLVFTLIAAAFSAGASQQPDIEVVLKPEADVRSHLIRLSDVAEIIPREADLAGALPSLTIGVAPALCQDTLLHADLVRNRLQEVFQERTVEIKGAQIVRVKRVCRTVPEKELADIGEKFIRKQMDWEDSEVEIKDVKAADVVLPYVDLSYAVTASPNEDFLGPVSLRITLKHDGEVLRRVRWQGWVSVMRDVVVASRTLDRNEVIREGDVRVERSDLSELHTNTQAKLSEVMGKRVTRRIAGGSLITSDDLDRPLWVERGNRVLIVAQSSHLRVTTKGVAREDGSRGEHVRVLNLSSKKEIVGEVVGPQIVRVAF